MARWDEILSLPVQNPPSLEFSAPDLVWSKIEGHRDNIDRLALIPFARVDDFVRGESANTECPTRFHVEARRRRPPEMPYKPKVDGILEYILYWCSFGPDDHRKGGIVRPSRSTYVPKKKSAGRPNTKRGCTCHFIVKRLIAEPSVALVIYNQDKHVDKKGLPCHGPQDKKAVGTRAMFAPYISEDLRLRVLSLLHVGVPVETIMQRHNELVEKQGGPSNRDDLLTHRYVRRQERNIRRSTCELDEDDDISISLWVESHQSFVFFYEDFSDADPFVLGIQTEWQLQQMIHFGNGRLLALDSRFGTNKLKYPIHSLVVFNSDNKAIPVAWIIAPSFCRGGDTHRWMRALFNRVHTKDPTWKLAGFIVDDPLADVLTIREVFQCSVLICFWRVRHAWHKNLMKRCSNMEIRAELSNRLGQTVKDIGRGHGTVDSFENFMEDFADCTDFMDYFKAVWYPRLGPWITALKTLPLASQESCAALEFYHYQLKIRLLNERDPDIYQRTDWLVDKLGTKVQAYFWLDEYEGKDDFSRYWKDEWASGLTAWRKSRMIRDSDVQQEGKRVKVVDQNDPDIAHVVWNPGSEYAICSCNWSEKGNLCEHVFKIIKHFRDKGSVLPSVSLLQYNQCLINMLKCPPPNSFIRDHAVSLAVWVNKQLSAQFGQQGSLPATDPMMAGENGIFGERDEMASSRAEIERESESVSVDGFATTDPLVEEEEITPLNAVVETTENTNSAGDASTYLNGSEGDSLDRNRCDTIDSDPQLAGVRQFGNDPLEPCTNINQHCFASNDAAPPVLVDENHQFDSMILSSMLIDEHAVDASDAAGENGLANDGKVDGSTDSHMIETSKVKLKDAIVADDLAVDNTLHSEPVPINSHTDDHGAMVNDDRDCDNTLPSGSMLDGSCADEVSDVHIDNGMVGYGHDVQHTSPSKSMPAGSHMDEEASEPIAILEKGKVNDECGTENVSPSESIPDVLHVVEVPDAENIMLTAAAAAAAADILQSESIPIDDLHMHEALGDLVENGGLNL